MSGVQSATTSEAYAQFGRVADESNPIGFKIKAPLDYTAW